MLSGTVLSGRYRLESLLGQGGMGAVWRAEHLGFKAPVAVKLMDAERARTAEGLARFHREAHAAAAIRSPHVVQVLDHGLDDETETPFIVMELLEGETLGTRLRRERNLSLATTASIVADVCRALIRAHQAGIVHRDLKPDNIFLVNDEREFAKVLDFGVAKANAFTVALGDGTRTGDMIGTPSYMSPEQIRGAKEIDGRSDLWSLAVIACECVTGKRPFAGNTLGDLAIAICSEPVPAARSLGPASPAFEAWLERALQRDPAKRFQSARELSESLLALSTGEATSVTADPQAPPAQSEPAAAGGTGVAPATPMPNTFGAQNASVVPKRPSRAKLGTLGVSALLLFGTALWFLREPAPQPAAAPAAEESTATTRSLIAAPSAPSQAAPDTATARAEPTDAVSVPKAPAVDVVPKARALPTRATKSTPTAAAPATNTGARAPSAPAVVSSATAGGPARPDPIKPNAPVAPSPARARPKLLNALSGDR